MLQTLWAVVRDGKIELSEQVRLPEGANALVTILPVEEDGSWAEVSQESLAADEKARTGRGKPVAALIGLGAGSGPPPSDEEVQRWLDEHRLEKYGR